MDKTAIIKFVKLKFVLRCSLILLFTALINNHWFIHSGRSSDSTPPITESIELAEAILLLKDYTYAKTVKDRLPFVYLGDISQDDFFIYYGSPDRKFLATKIVDIKQVDQNTFTVERILIKQNVLSIFTYKLRYVENKLFIDWETSLQNKFRARMNEIALKKEKERKIFWNSLWGNIVTLVGLGIAFILFLIPSVLGFRKRHIKAIYAVNFLILAFLLLPPYGIHLTVLGWLGCLAWSLRSPYR